MHATQVRGEGRLAHAGQPKDNDRPVAGEALAQLSKELPAGHCVAWGGRNRIELGRPPAGVRTTLATRLGGQLEEPGGQHLIALQAERWDNSAAKVIGSGRRWFCSNRQICASL